MTRPLADELLDHLRTHDPQAAAAHLTSLVDGGLSLAAIVDEGLAPAMSRVGALWESAEWSVVDEHEATTVAEAALSAAAAQCDAHEVRGDVVVACAPGDWHSLAARMVAEVLSAHGWTVRFLGASHTTALLLDHLARRPPQAVLLSCVVPMALPALAEAVKGIHGLALPVYVGGRALGDGPGRAASLGADGWAASAADAVELLHQRPLRLGVPDLSSRLQEHTTRRRAMPVWSRAAGDLLQSRAPAPAHLEALAEDVQADLVHLLEMASVSLLLDDDSLLVEQCAWLSRVLESRGHVPGVVDHALTALRLTRPGSQQALLLDEALSRAQQGRRRTTDDAQSDVPAAPPEPRDGSAETQHRVDLRRPSRQ